MVFFPEKTTALALKSRLRSFQNVPKIRSSFSTSSLNPFATATQKATHSMILTSLLLIKHRSSNATRSAIRVLVLITKICNWLKIRKIVDSRVPPNLILSVWHFQEESQQHLADLVKFTSSEDVLTEFLEADDTPSLPGFSNTNNIVKSYTKIDVLYVNYPFISNY